MLLVKIDEVRNSLHELIVSNHNNLDSIEVIKLSQQLDSLLVEYIKEERLGEASLNKNHKNKKEDF